MTSDPSAGHLRLRRLVFLVLLSLFLGWTGLQGLREFYRAGWYSLADPWPAAAPVQWTLRSHHAQQLEALATRLRPCLETAGVVGVTTPTRLGEQGFYLHLWLSYVLPEHDLRRVTRTAEGLAANSWLWLDSQDPPPADLEAVCSSGSAKLYDVTPTLTVTGQPVTGQPAGQPPRQPLASLTGLGPASALIWATAFLAACVAIGWGPAIRWLKPRDGVTGPWLWAGMAGSLLVWLWLWLSDALGLPWSRPWLVVGCGGLLLLSGWLTRSFSSRATDAGFPDEPATEIDLSSQPEAPALARLLTAVLWLGPTSALATLAIATAWLWNVHPDFVFHWGVKSAKFFLHQGLDFAYLSRPWNFAIHPDYPNLIPGLETASAVLAGAFVPRAAIFSSLFHVLLLNLAVIELAARSIRDKWLRALAIAAVSWAITMFAISSKLAGGADLAMAAAATAGAALLCQPRGLQTSLAVAVVAAWAASTKIEGMPLAVALVALHLSRQFWPRADRQAGRHSDRCLPRWQICLASAGLPTVVMIAWAAQTASHGLFQAANTSTFELSRWRLIGVELVRAASVDIWHLLPWGLLALPLLLVDRVSRWPALLCCGQLAFYLYAYFSGPVDTAFWIQTSAPRLFFHLLPIVWILAIAFGDRLTRASQPE